MSLNRVTLADVLETVQVTEKIQMDGRNKRCRMVELRFSFLPRKAYKDKYSVTPENVLHYFENKFIKKVRTIIFATRVDKCDNFKWRGNVAPECLSRLEGNCHCSQ